MLNGICFRWDLDDDFILDLDVALSDALNLAIISILDLTFNFVDNFILIWLFDVFETANDVLPDSDFTDTLEANDDLILELDLLDRNFSTSVVFLFLFKVFVVDNDFSVKFEFVVNWAEDEIVDLNFDNLFIFNILLVFSDVILLKHNVTNIDI